MTSASAGAESMADWLRDRKSEVDEALEHCLPTPPGIPLVITAPVAYSVRAGGKRLRPILTLAAAEAAGAVAEPRLDADTARKVAMPIACAIEMIHTYSLIHDDLPAMDNDVLRRGQPTLHVVHGEGLAILAGDALVTDAFGILARGATDPRTAAQRLRIIGRVAEAAGAAGMVGGQAVDLHLSGQGGPNAPPLPAPGLDVLRDMHARKTGALIRAAAVAGAISADGTDAAVAAIDEFAAELGLAFQIVDDVLDVEGTDEALGKTAGKDAAAGKLTYPALVGVEASKRMAHEAVERGAAALTRAGVPADRLLGIADWVVVRRS
jgi:geranylgeranyl diphosphate synthase type II